MVYDFSELKLFVKTHLGIDPDNINSNFQPITKKLTQEELIKSVEFDVDGIFYVDKKGKKHKGFLYIEKGYSRATAIARGGETIIPKFHTVNCRTIHDMKDKKRFDGHYVFSTEVILMEDLDGEKKEPEICGNCTKLQEGVYRGMKTSNYREEIILKEQGEGNFFDTELPKDVTTDFWGYTSNWDETSKNYRMAKKFTCEKCGLNLNQNLVNGYYLETHHIDGNKLNNENENLQCLCVLCHANFDKFHEENYSRGSGHQKLIDFIKLFEDELRKVNNPYLNKYKKRR